MIIIFVGYTGSNKKKIAKIISDKLGLNYIHLNDLIEEKEKLSISKILLTRGDVIYRNIENKYLKNVLKNNTKLVLCLDEGTPCYSSNIKLLTAKNVVCIYLKYSINSLLDILFTNPPIILRNFSKNSLKEYIAKHLFERNAYYNKSNIIIDCDQKSETKIIKEILTKLNY
tara:strand:- start:1391 stop:1903 length:513 start_codon:yes stop_codon:yes gene_type:complete